MTACSTYVRGGQVANPFGDQWYKDCVLPGLNLIPIPDLGERLGFFGSYDALPLLQRAFRAFYGMTRTGCTDLVYALSQQSPALYWPKALLSHIVRHIIPCRNWVATMSDEEEAFCRYGAYIAQQHIVGEDDILPDIHPKVACIAALVLTYSQDLGPPTLNDYGRAGIVPYSDLYNGDRTIDQIMDYGPESNPYHKHIQEHIVGQNPNYSDVACHYTLSSGLRPLKFSTPASSPHELNNDDEDASSPGATPPEYDTVMSYTGPIDP